LQGVFEAVDKSLTSDDGEKETQQMVEFMKGTPLPLSLSSSLFSPLAPSPSRTKAAVLYASLSFRSFDAPGTAQAQHGKPPRTRVASWVRAGAATTIQCAWRQHKRAKKGEKSEKDEKRSRKASTLSRRALTWRGDFATDARARVVLARGVAALLKLELHTAREVAQRAEKEREERLRRERKKAKTLAKREELTRKHPILGPQKSKFTKKKKKKKKKKR
jgi:hypothetical protein